MKILSSNQMREADAFTIKNEPVTSFDLMERAGKACYEWIVKNSKSQKKFVIICGTGNNGGDGLVIARNIAQRKMPVEVIILHSGNEPSQDFTKDLDMARSSSIHISEIKEGDQLELAEGTIIIDAIFGTGLSRPVSGWIGECIERINNSGNEIISIDLPSGLFADQHSDGRIVFANHTITFQCPKTAFFFSENERYIGKFHVLDIDLDLKFIDGVIPKKQLIEIEEVCRLLHHRNKFSHKGTFGRSLLICGSKGKMGPRFRQAERDQNNP